jgi:hypothetical protein
MSGSAIGHALANPGGKIYCVLRERDMLTPEIIGRIFGVRRQPPPWSLPGVGNGPWRKWSRRLLRFTRRRFDSLAPWGRAAIGEEDLERLTGAVISVLKQWTRL